MQPATVTVHPSQFPDTVRRQLLDSLRTRQVNPKFHYDTLRQTRQWLALHQAHSPSRTDPDCTAIYDRAFHAVATHLRTTRVHIVGLGAGGGQKDTRLLALLKSQRRDPSYTPCDSSLAMVLVARQSSLAVIPDANCFPLVCDLAAADDLPDLLAGIQRDADVTRIVTCFGIIPNFEPPVILGKLAALLRPDDWLLLSTNLAPGDDYDAGIRRVLPQYDNRLTRDWLLTFLLDLGIERDDGRLLFDIEPCPAGSGWKRIVATFRFSRARSIHIDAETFAFNPADAIRVFFSYRCTPSLLRTLARGCGLDMTDQWTTNSGEEALFLVRRA